MKFKTSLFVCVLLTGCAKSYLSIDSMDFNPAIDCLDLSGTAKVQVAENQEVRGAVFEDAVADKRPAEFYKIVPSSVSGRFSYIFRNTKYSDQYWAYVVDEKRPWQIGKFAFGSFHEPQGNLGCSMVTPSLGRLK